MTTLRICKKHGFEFKCDCFHEEMDRQIRRNCREPLPDAMVCDLVRDHDGDHLASDPIPRTVGMRP